jgi:hypothetical protein
MLENLGRFLQLQEATAIGVGGRGPMVPISARLRIDPDQDREEIRSRFRYLGDFTQLDCSGP